VQRKLLSKQGIFCFSADSFKSLSSLAICVFFVNIGLQRARSFILIKEYITFTQRLTSVHEEKIIFIFMSLDFNTLTYPLSPCVYSSWIQQLLVTCQSARQWVWGGHVMINLHGIFIFGFNSVNIIPDLDRFFSIKHFLISCSKERTEKCMLAHGTI
jgi:hypothetical protein